MVGCGWMPRIWKSTKARREIVWDYFKACNLDDKNKNPSRYFPLPGGWPRNLYDDAGNHCGIGRQELLAVNVGPASWAEYERANTQPKTYIEFLKTIRNQSLSTPVRDSVSRGRIILSAETFCHWLGRPGWVRGRQQLPWAKPGRRGLDWFGLPVHCRFKNADYPERKRAVSLEPRNLRILDAPLLDQYLRVTPPPDVRAMFRRGWVSRPVKGPDRFRYARGGAYRSLERSQ